MHSCSLQTRPARSLALPVRPFTENKSTNQRSIQNTLNSNISRVLGATAAAIVLATAPASYAELQTVSADQVTSMAKPLKVQTVNKSRIWLLFVLGASSLFGITLVAENNEAWFPAISRANKAMKASMAAIEAKEKRAAQEQEQFDRRLEEVQMEKEEDYRLESAVAEGIVQAKRPPTGAVVDVTPAAAAIAAAAVEEEKEEEEVVVEQQQQQPSTPATYPTELAADVAEDVDDSLVVESASSSSSNGASSASAEEEESVASGISRAAPLFEISGDQIEASVKNKKQQEVLNELSIEDLQRELEARKAAAGSGQQGSD